MLTTNKLQAFSVNAVLQPQAGSAAKITFPLLQGMGFVTGIYTGLQPIVNSGIQFLSIVPIEVPRQGVFKYKITLVDNKSWVMYAMPDDGQNPGFQLVSSTTFKGPADWSGFIQIAKNPAGSTGEFSYDKSAGFYATSATVSGSTLGVVGTYTISWTKAGLYVPPTAIAPPLIMFALPHHVASLGEATAASKLHIKLQTTTKGVATAVFANSWTLIEPNLPTDMGFAPWTPTKKIPTFLNSAALNTISQVAVSEVNQNMTAQTNLDSMYFSGKALSKFATLVYTIHDLLHMPDLALQGLNELKGTFARFVTNRQIHPLVYDTVWGGVVSSGTYTTGNTVLDFGNALYNDHHFHYGYFIHAAAVIAYLEPSWLELNKDWVNMLVRDAANPSSEDVYFPFSRMFDWYHGHSWAKGLFESADGKDEESSSEDAMFAYAVKMWGHVTGDQSMEARGNTMLSILARTLQSYFLLSSDNTNQAPNFIGNKVTGVVSFPSSLPLSFLPPFPHLSQNPPSNSPTNPPHPEQLFENKVDHTTYFGASTEYIQGIHMLPLLPYSSLTRPPRFVAEEWNTYFNTTCPTPAHNVQGGWKGILYANLALVDPRAAWRFFSQSGFDAGWIDGGASRTWYLAWCAGE